VDKIYIYKFWYFH